MSLHIVQGKSVYHSLKQYDRLKKDTHDPDLEDFLKYCQFKLEPNPMMHLSLYSQIAPVTLWDTQAGSCVRLLGVEGDRNLNEGMHN